MSWTEPSITINGVELTMGQATALRVALSCFAVSLDDPEELAQLGEIGLLYRERLGELFRLMFPAEKPRPPTPNE